MNEEDEAFNEIERQAKQRKESVKAQLVPLACERCKQLEEQAYDLLGQLKVANIKLAYTQPPQRTWVGLTDEEIWTVLQFRGYNTDTIEIAQAIEAKLKEKNT